MAEEVRDIPLPWPEWKIRKQLGRGSYGVVYEAVRRERQLESRSAVKVISIPRDEGELDSLRSEGMTEEAARTYLQSVVNDFTGEIRLMESLKGTSNIVGVEDYKVLERQEGIGWTIYIRMELLTPLTSYLEHRAPGEGEVIRLGRDLCAALERCARRNVIHRDIKPENIFLNEDGDFKLGDFGVARKLDNVSGALSRRGTPNYMAPEVQRGSGSYDARADIYSLGLVLYWLMNQKRLPFLFTEEQRLNPQERETALLRRLRGDPLPPPCDASPALAKVILGACAYDPGDRYPDARALSHALAAAGTGAEETLGRGGYPDGRTLRVRAGRGDAGEGADVLPGPWGDAPPYPQGGGVGSFGESRSRKLAGRILAALAGAVLALALVLVLPGLLEREENETVSSGESDTVESGETPSQGEEPSARETEDQGEAAAAPGSGGGSDNAENAAADTAPAADATEGGGADSAVSVSDPVPSAGAAGGMVGSGSGAAPSSGTGGSGEMTGGSESAADGSGYYSRYSEPLLFVKDVSDGLNLRAEPNHHSALVGTVRDDSILYYYGETGQGLGSDGKIHDWYLVELDNGTRGWARSDLIRAAGQDRWSSSAPVRVFRKNVSSGLNLRAEPRHESAQVYRVLDDAPLYFYGETGQGYGSDGVLHTWYWVELENGVGGWARSDLLEEGG